jgi:aldehyde dehydrogenase (NAD+)
MAVASSSPSVSGRTDVVAALRTSYNAGITRPLSWRRAQLEAMRRLLSEREDDLLDALAADLGKPAVEGWMTELHHLSHEIGHILRHLGSWVRPSKIGVRPVLRPARARVMSEPLGVVLVISPWHYPVHLSLLPMAYAIAAGNAVVGKPSEISAATSEALARLVPEYLDPSTTAIVEGDATVASGLLEQCWDHIFYTGKGSVGRVVMEAAARHLTPVTLELGGKSPAIVDRSANIGVAARRIAWGKFQNAGQTCVAPDYILVDRVVEPQLVDALAGAVRSFYGENPKQSPDLARIVNVRQWDRLMRLVPAADSERLVVGGDGDRKSLYMLRRSCVTSHGMTRSSRRRCSAPSCRSSLSTASRRPSMRSIPMTDRLPCTSSPRTRRSWTGSHLRRPPAA